MPKFYECPHCRGPTISLWRKLCLGPAAPTVCSKCGGRVGVPWVSLWISLPMGAVGTSVAMLLGPARRSMTGPSRALVVILLAGVVGLLMVVWLRKVPLIKR